MSDRGAAELPAGWRIARVGEILKIRNGYAFKSTDYKEVGVPLIRQSELRSEVVDTTEAKRVDPKFLANLSGFVVREGDLLIGMSGSLGKIAEYQEKQPALQNQRTGLLVLKPGYDAKFAKLGCMVVTRRTANVTKTILNQCNTVFAMRTFDETGKEFLANYIGREYAASLSSISERHAVLFGKASSCENPILIRLNDREKFLAAFRAVNTPPPSPSPEFQQGAATFEVEDLDEEVPF